MRSPRDDITVRAPDGRTLRVAECGDADGPAVIFHHGWPSSRLLPPGHSEAAQERGLRLVSFDRAGYGGSSRAPGRTVGDVAADVAAIADALGIGAFGVWGVSGGGPHALACAALLRERVLAAALVAGVAPFDLPGLDFCAGMGEASLIEFPLAAQGIAAYEPYVRDAVATVLASADGGDVFDSVLSPVDRQLMQSGRFDAYIQADKREALGRGIYGWLDDGLACVAPWGFELTAIETPVLLLQGGEDLMVPPAHARAMAAVLPSATLEFHPEEGHMTLGLAPERALDWLEVQLHGARAPHGR
jgi:pimeloyl-ACP methyl ester carboxylesterase